VTVVVVFLFIPGVERGKVEMEGEDGDK